MLARMATVFMDGVLHRLAAVVQLRPPQLPAVGPIDISAQLDTCGAGPDARGARLRLIDEALAAEGLRTEHPIKRGGRSPVQSQTVIIPVPAQKAAVQQRPLDKIIGMRMLLIEVANLRGKTSGTQL